MSFNEEAADLFAYQRVRLDDVEATTDMEALPGLLGYTLHDAKASRLTGREIHIKTKQSKAKRWSDIAHETSHALSEEKDQPDHFSYEETIRHRHAHTPNVDAQLEAIITVGQDMIRMPQDVLKTVLNICGLNAMAVWVLHQQVQVHLNEALRRIVHHDQDARIGGFIARAGRIIYAYSYRWRMPCWIDDPMPDLDEESEGGCVSTFAVPGLSELVIGLVVIDESGPI